MLYLIAFITSRAVRIKHNNTKLYEGQKVCSAAVACNMLQPMRSSVLLHSFRSQWFSVRRWKWWGSLHAPESFEQYENDWPCPLENTSFYWIVLSKRQVHAFISNSILLFAKAITSAFHDIHKKLKRITKYVCMSLSLSRVCIFILYVHISIRAKQSPVI